MYLGAARPVVYISRILAQGPRQTMRIAIVTQSYHPRPGGVTEHVYHTAEALGRRGHDVFVVTTHFEANDRSENDVIRIGRNVLVPMNGAWVNMAVGTNLQTTLERELASIEPDVIHTHCPLTPTLPLMTLRTAGLRARIVGTFHAAANSNFAYRLFRSYLEPLAQRLDARIAVSRPARDLARRYFPGEYVIIPNGIDCERFSPRVAPLDELRDDAFNILYVGRMDKRKGLKYLFRAVRTLARRLDRRLRLVVVGDNGLRRFLLPDLPRNVDILMAGLVDKRLVPRYFASCDVFCAPAVGRESFGIVLLEAMASGIPLVATEIPGYLTLVRHRWNALVVPPRDHTALASAVETLANDERLRWTLRANALAFARCYSWDRVVGRIESAYHGEFGEEELPVGRIEAQKA